MQLRLTFVTPGAPGGERVEVEVDASSGTTFSEVWDAAARALGLAPGSRPDLYAAQTRVPPDHLLGFPPLIDGALVHIGSPEQAVTVAERAAVELHVVSGPDSGRVVPLGVGSHVVGRAGRAAVAIEDGGVSRWHAEITVTATGTRIRDLGSTNGTRIRGTTIAGEPVELRPGVPVHLGRSTLIVRRPLRAGPPPAADGEGHLIVHPNAPVPVPPDPVVVQLPADPRPETAARLSLAILVVPAVLAVVMALAVGNALYLLMGLAGPLMAVGSYAGDRRHQRRSSRRRWAAHAARTASAMAAFARAVEEEQARRFDRAPDAARLLRAATARHTDLWGRQGDHPDWGVVRVGVGRQPAQATLRAPDGSIRDAEVTAPLTCRLVPGSLVALAGPAPLTRGLARSILGQLAALHAPGDVVLSVVGDPSAWNWVTRLPHWRPAGLPGNDRAALDVLLVDGPWGHGAQPARPGAGVCTIVLCEPGAEPSGAQVRVRLSGDSRLELAGSDGEGQGMPDLVSESWAASLAAELTPLRAGARAGEVPLSDSVDLLDLMDFDATSPVAVARRWAASPSSTQTVLGSTGHAGFAVDLVRDGPHVLVAGTTGAGKSELLQTLVAGLAAVNRPDAMSFVLVDYKGGAAFRDCARLPHTTGLVTDLDPGLTRRALTSLRAELRRRERLFHAAGVADLGAYHRVRRPDLPALGRLVIVVDEFRMLADELPDFLHGLVSVATLGRSLGIHLVLATQRPAGVVSADIQANVNLRIALRLRDDGESLGVIDDRCAAGISHLTPGRAYVRSGETPPRLVQTARVSGSSRRPGHAQVRVRVARDGRATAGTHAVRDPMRRADAREEGTRRASANGAAGRAGLSASDGVPTPTTDLALIVAAVQEAADALGVPRVPSAWLPPLPDVIAADALPEPDHPDRVPVGLVDLPEQQSQQEFVVDLAAGRHLAIVGGPRSGRTEALVTLAGRLSLLGPKRSVTYLVGAGDAQLRAMSGLPGVACAVTTEEPVRLARLVQVLAKEVEARRSTAETGGDPAYLCLLVDGWEAVLGALEELPDQGRSAEQLRALLRDGLAARVRCVATGGRGLLASRTAAVFADRLVLATADVGEAVAAGVRAADVPRLWPPGRAIRVADGAAIQLALTSPASLRRFRARNASGPTPGPIENADRAPRVELLPRCVRADEVGSPPRRPDLALLGVGGDHRDPLGLPLDGRHRAALVVGPPRSGRTSCLATIAQSLAQAGRQVGIVAAQSAPLSALRGPHVTHLVDADGVRSLLRQQPDACLIVDDASGVEDTPVGDQLRALLGDPSGQAALVCAAGAADLASRFRGLLVDLARHRHGVLLNPSKPSDGDCLGVRPLGVDMAVPGRGYLVLEGAAIQVQVALPADSLSSPP